MTTDITELAQREKFEAWFKSSFHPDKTGPYIKDQLYFAWKAASAELVEALESEKRICATWRKTAESTGEKLEKAQETIAFQQGEIKALLSSLESRTVKLPPKIERNDIDGWFMYKGGRVGGGAAEWYNNALDDVGAELTAAGIKVEAE
ncbi:TPA: hypothetical protein ACNMOY_002509 [Klebsiella pneumoniae]|nr:hypothetical protein [Klebsiella pneumoniae]SWX16214.1 RelE family toxin-antitoxin system [Klebsiella pneumoniae]